MKTTGQSDKKIENAVEEMEKEAKAKQEMMDQAIMRFWGMTPEAFQGLLDI